MAGQGLTRSVRQFLEWTRLASLNPNRITAMPESIADEAQGDSDTMYRLGYYQLGQGEWLEAILPESPQAYWSLHAYNHWCESLPGAGRHDRNAAPDADGRIRIAIGPDAPIDARNRIDTLGRRRGVLLFRAIGDEAASIPEVILRRA